MTYSVLKKLLKLLSVMGMCLLALPLFLLAEGSIFTDISPLRIGIYYLISGCYGLLGYFCSMLVKDIVYKKKFTKQLVHILIRILAVACPFTTMPIISAFSKTQSIQMDKFPFANFFLLTAPVVLFMFYLGYIIRKEVFSDIFTLPWLWVFAVETVFAYIFFNVAATGNQNFSTGKDMFYIVSIIVAMIAIILINQTNINTQAQRRHGSFSIIPKNLRGYNMKLISGVGLILLALVLFKDLIANALLGIFKIIIYIINYLLSLLPSGSKDVVSEDSMDKIEKVFGDSSNFPSVLIVFFAIIVLFIIFKLRKQIFSLISKLISMILGHSKDLKAEEINEDEAYVDYLEYIVPKDKKSKIYTLNDSIKAFDKEMDNVKKFRIGYRIFMLWAVEHNVRIEAADTVNEQFKKAERIFNEEAKLDIITGDYERLRYADMPVTTQNIDIITNFVDNIKKTRLR